MITACLLFFLFLMVKLYFIKEISSNITFPLTMFDLKIKSLILGINFKKTGWHLSKDF